MELASPPLAPFGTLVRTVAADAEVLHDRLAAHGIAVSPHAADPVRPARRVLDLPRYRAMEHRFDRVGPWGRSGMCSTAAVQVCVDAGEGAEVAQPLGGRARAGPGAGRGVRELAGAARAAHRVEVVAARRVARARSAAHRPTAVGAGRSGGARGPGGCSTPSCCASGAPTAGGTRRPASRSRPGSAGSAELPPPTTADLEYHISTLFPPVRPRGHLEVRYLDAQPGRRWALPAAVLAALLADPAVTDRAREACEPTVGRWMSAARHGLADRVLQRAAVTVFELAVAALPRLDAPSWLVADLAVMLERRVRRGLCPADLHTTGPHLPALPAAPTRPAPPATPAAGPADVPEEARA